MNSHNQSDDWIDLSLRHSLKNWATHKDPPSDAREKLLAAARQGEKSERRRPSRFNFGGWSFQFPNNLSEVAARATYRYTLESIYALKSMAIM